jgi:hypothetical protein
MCDVTSYVTPTMSSLNEEKGLFTANDAICH